MNYLVVLLAVGRHGHHVGYYSLAFLTAMAAQAVPYPWVDRDH
jgi:hypothetical protein